MTTTCSPCQIILAEDNPADWAGAEALREHHVHCDLFVIGDGEQVLSFIDRLDFDAKLPSP